jgi:hypothetical protein
VNLPDENTLCFEYLKNLKQTKNLGEDTLLNMVHEAIAIGAETAGPYIGADVVEEVQKYGVVMKMVTGGFWGNKLFRAQYDESTKVITVFEDGVGSMLRTKGPEEVGIEATVEQVRNVLLWHEFFHILEFNKIGLVGEKYRIPTKVLWFHFNCPLYQISEISANVFAKKVMSLRQNPFVFDYIIKHEEDES